MINNQTRREEFNRRRNYKGTQSFCEGYECPIFQNCLVEINQFKKEKQQLISWLEDKIKEIDKTIPSDLICAISMRSDKLAELNAYQTILNFVNKGGKE